MSDICMVVYKGKKYFGTINMINSATKAANSIDHNDVAVVGVGRKRFMCNAAELQVFQGITECPWYVTNCDNA